MFTGLLGEVPLLWKVPVLLVFVILLMFVMILLAGYEVRLPLFLGKIGPANAASKDNLALEKQITELKGMLTSMRSQNIAVDGSSENCLEFDSRKSSVTRQVSGIEELVPLGYDCHQKSHPPALNIQPRESGTPRKEKLKKSLILTPVKGRVMSQPDLFQKQIHSDSGDQVMEDQVLDLTRKRSDSFPKSPVKNLVVKDFDSPKSTKFEWVSTEDVDENEELDVRTVCKELLIEDENPEQSQSTEFLNKVEDLFKSPHEV